MSSVITVLAARFAPPLALPAARRAAARPCHRLALWAWAALWVALAWPCGAAAQQFTFQRFGSNDGLSNLAARCLEQDRAGFLWVCTENGLFRFDGRHFERTAAAQGLRDANVRSLALDAQGRQWVGTPTDLYVGDGKRFTALRPGGMALSQSRPGQRILPIDADTVLLLHQEQLLRLSRPAPDAPWAVAPYFSTATLAAQPALSKIHAVLRDADGSVWLGCSEQLCHARDGAVRVFDAADGVVPTPWRTLLRDRGGRLWARGVAGVAVLEPGAARFTPRDPPDVLLAAADTYAPMIEDPQGRILTRTNAGIARWDGSAWRGFNGSNGLVAATTTALLADRDGGLWQADFGRGIARWLGYGQWEAWTNAQGLGLEAVWDINRSADGDLLVHTNNGCMRLAPQAQRLAECAIPGLPRVQILSSARARDGTLFVSASNTDIYRIDPQLRSARRIATLPRSTRLLLDADGRRLWSATTEGPYLLTPPADGDPDGPWTATNPSGDSTGTGTVAQGADGRLWFASEKGLLLRQPNGRWTLIAVTDARGQAAVDTVTVAPDGAVWVATQAGLARLLIDGDRLVQRDVVDGPLTSDLSAIFLRFDRRGWLWYGTDAGLSFFDGRTWRRLDTADGLVWNDIDLDAFYEDDDGSLWFGTSGGLSHLMQPVQAAHASPLTAHIVAARYGARALDSGSRRLPWLSDAALDVRIAALDPAQAQGARFRYRIVGMSNEWFETGNAEIHTPSLAPGHYRLEVVAFKTNAALTSLPVTLAFDVLPPWWRDPWVHAIAAALVALALALAWRRRTRVLQARHTHLEQLLERATRDPLTGLWNRATIIDMLASAVVQARADGSPLAVALIDIDHFKRINDQHGHLAGDAVLRGLGRQLAANVRTGDSLGRYGGEELLLVMRGAPRTQPLQTVERLRLLIEQTGIPHDGQTLRVTASFGVEWLGPEAPDVDALIGRADIALYAAKSSGRNRVAYACAHALPVVAVEPPPPDAAHAA